MIRPDIKKWLESLKTGFRSARKNAKSCCSTAFYAFSDPETPVSVRILLWLALAYAASPVDLIPDFIPLLGQLDDLVIIPLLVALAFRLMPSRVLRRCEERAASDPPTLRSRPFAVITIIAVQSAVILWIVSAVVRLFRSGS